MVLIQPHPLRSCDTRLAHATPPYVLFMISAAAFGLAKNIHVIFSYNSEGQLVIVLLL
jgi:hypothetical protein